MSNKKSVLLTLSIISISFLASAAICAAFMYDRLSIKHFSLPDNVFDVTDDAAFRSDVVFYTENDAPCAYGWAVHLGVANDRYINAAILLKDETGNYYKLKTINTNRFDVTEFIGDGINYDRAGFYATGRQTDLKSGKYGYALLLTESDGSAYLMRFDDYIEI